MKTILSLILLCFISMKTIAKNSDSAAFNAGKIILSMGYGYPSLEQSQYGGIDPNYSFISFTKNNYGPFHFRGEYGLTNKIGIGISMNYDNYGGTMKEVHTINHSNGITEYYTSQKTTSSFTGLIRFNYHFATTKKLDPYLAVGGGFRTTTNSFTTNDPNGSLSQYNLITISRTPSNISFESLVGLKYYFSKNIGIYSEIGISKSVIQIGLSVGF